MDDDTKCGLRGRSHDSAWFRCGRTGRGDIAASSEDVLSPARFRRRRQPSRSAVRPP